MQILEVTLFLVEGCRKDDEVFLADVYILADLLLVVERIVCDLLNAGVQTSDVVLSVCVGLLIEHEEDMRWGHLVDLEVLKSPATNTK